MYKRQPNGKGLDVSFALKKFGVDSVALGFFAGFTGKFIVDETMNMGCLCRPVWTDGITRINTYLNDGEHEYGILNPGAPLTPQYEQELYLSLIHICLMTISRWSPCGSTAAPIPCGPFGREERRDGRQVRPR